MYGTKLFFVSKKKFCISCVLLFTCGWVGEGDGRGGSDITSHILYLDIVVSLQIGSMHAIISLTVEILTIE